MSSTQHERHGDWYEIHIQGRLDDRWSSWLDDLDVAHPDDGTTVLRGPVADQAALHGLLHKIRDLGLPLLSVTQTGPDAPATPAHRADPPTSTPAHPSPPTRRHP
jgi:hypothetical protein